ncbi:MAG: hypothetical protein IKC69_07505 [Clostridia bacterium]|nr:hypothetical protein [Clostridia bacterium]
MKKLIALLLATLMILSFVGCAAEANKESADKKTETATVADTKPATEAETKEPATEEEKPFVDTKSEGVMTYDQYVAAELESDVVIEAYVQATQSWWDNKITVYTQDDKGAYFIYEMACNEEDAKRLTPGTKIRVTGVKGAWAGEVEVMDATFEFVADAPSFIAKPLDVTALLGTDDLIKHQNEMVSFKGMTVKKIEYKNGEPGDDIYVTLSKNGADYAFCVERYLTDPESEVYKAVGELKEGAIVDVEGFLYWYEGMNPHITSIKEGAMTHADYMAAAIDSEVVVDVYVQAKQSWWDNKVTVYAADEDGAYFIYEMACDEDDNDLLTAGTKIRVKGTKGEWAGEVEIMDATFTFIYDLPPYVAEVFDATALLGTDDLIKHQNELVSFKEMTVKKIEYKNGEPGDDIYVTLTKGEADYAFCVERYLTDPETEVYKAVGELKEGDVIDVEGFLYWYEGMNPHITKIVKK